MRKIIKNKKADISITILVIGVFLVCVIVLSSFYFTGLGTEEVLSISTFMEEMNSQIERYNLYKNLQFSDEEIKEILDIRTDSNGDYLYIEGQKGKIISIKYYLRK